jgi:hypothetical protein
MAFVPVEAYLTVSACLLSAIHRCAPHWEQYWAQQRAHGQHASTITATSTAAAAAAGPQKSSLTANAAGRLNTPQQPPVAQGSSKSSEGVPGRPRADADAADEPQLTPETAAVAAALMQLSRAQVNQNLQEKPTTATACCCDSSGGVAAAGGSRPGKTRMQQQQQVVLLPHAKAAADVERLGARFRLHLPLQEKRATLARKVGTAGASCYCSASCCVDGAACQVWRSS